MTEENATPRRTVEEVAGEYLKEHPPGQQPGAPTPAPPEHIMQFFAYEHLRPDLQAISKPFAELARRLVGQRSDTDTTESIFVPRNPERTVALRKLLEAKDAAVRALLAK